nr:hypothetical protein [Tanacetum cinerariifolium]
MDQAPVDIDGFAPHWFGEHFLNINNGWIEWDVPLEGEVDEPMVDPEVNEEVGGPSTTAIKGPSFPLPSPELPMPPTVIKDLGTRLERDVPLEGEVDEPMVDPEVNEEVMDDDWDVEVEWLMAPVTPPRATMTVSSTYETRKMEEVSDAEVADRIAIGEIHPRVATVEEQVQVMETQTVQVVSRLEEIETRVQRVESRLDTHPSGQMTVTGQDVIAGSSKQVQTLQTELHKTELQNQHLRTRVAEMESHMGIVMPYMLWMEERLTVLEKRLPGPPPGPQ